MSGRRWVTGGLLGVLCVGAGAPAQAAQTRYSIVGGCFTLAAPNGNAVPNASKVRLQATALGRYLLYRPDRSFVAADGGTA